MPHILVELDALTALALAGQVTDRIELGTAVVPTYPRHLLAIAQQAMSTQAATDGRLVLGIGLAAPGVVIENMFGLSYDQPARHTEYVDVLRLACGNRPRRARRLLRLLLDARGSLGRRLRRSSSPLAPLMLRMAGEVSDGTITYWSDERRSLTTSSSLITKAADNAGRPAPWWSAYSSPSSTAWEAARERAATLFATCTRPSPRTSASSPEGGGRSRGRRGHRDRARRAHGRAYADAGATDLCAAPLGLGSERDASWRDTVDLLASLTPDF